MSGSIFENKIVKLLTDYKIIAKKHYSQEQAADKINRFGLKRKVLRQDNALILYRKACLVVEDIATYLNDDKTPPSWYSGLDEFYQHLKSFLDDYKIENNHLINTAQQASCALVEALQLMDLPENRRGLVTAQKVDVCAMLVARYGTHAQQEMLAKALKKYQQHDVNFFLPLLRKFEKYLQNFAALFTIQHNLDPEV